MEKLFDKIYNQFQLLIEQNRKKFEAHYDGHVGEHSSIIFNRYWSMEGSSNSYDGEENEKISVRTKRPYNDLPEELKKLIN